MTDLGGFLARHRAERVGALTDRLVHEIQQANPRYREDVVPVADLRRSCHDNIERVLELLAEAVAGRTADDGSYDAARATGTRRSEQGLPLDDVLQSFRFGGRLIWDDLVDSAEVLDPADLRVLGTHLWQVVDETSAQVAAAYHATERARVAADEQHRAELWEGLLAGRAADPGFADDAARILDLPRAGRHLVVAVGTAVPWRSTQRLPGAVLHWVGRSPGAIAVVVLETAGPAAVHAELAARLDTAVGVSGLVSGLAGLERGYRQALVALRTLGGRPGLAAFDDRLPEALLLTSPDVSARLLDLWLGPLLALPGPEAEPLLETLRHWVASGGSATRAAVLGHCHRNTVVNRLHRVGGLLGRDLMEGPPPIELALALRVLAVSPG